MTLRILSSLLIQLNWQQPVRSRSTRPSTEKTIAFWPRASFSYPAFSTQVCLSSIIIENQSTTRDSSEISQLRNIFQDTPARLVESCSSTPCQYFMSISWLSRCLLSAQRVNYPECPAQAFIVKLPALVCSGVQEWSSFTEKITFSEGASTFTLTGSPTQRNQEKQNRAPGARLYLKSRACPNAASRARFHIDIQQSSALQLRFDSCPFGLPQQRQRLLLSPTLLLTRQACSRSRIRGRHPSCSRMMPSFFFIFSELRLEICSAQYKLGLRVYWLYSWLSLRLAASDPKFQGRRNTQGSYRCLLLILQEWLCKMSLLNCSSHTFLSSSSSQDLNSTGRGLGSARYSAILSSASQSMSTLRSQAFPCRSTPRSSQMRTSDSRPRYKSRTSVRAARL